MKTTSEKLENRKGLGLAVSVILGTLLFGCLGFFYVVIAEALVKQRFGEPQTPYGQPAMFSIVVCAFLGGLMGMFMEKAESPRVREFSLAYGLVTGAIGIWYLSKWQNWNEHQWDSSSYIIFPIVLLAVVANLATLAMYLTYVRFKKLLTKRREQDSDD
ncbi:MAG: hypothetical protein KDA72_03455 [Planctomycetales bacterium]|nr:hypothetical protein [Planctomycetales bacterium]